MSALPQKRQSRRLHPPDAGLSHLHPAVVGPHVCAPPAASGAPASLRNLSQPCVAPEALGRKRASMMTRPVAGSLAETVDKQSCGTGYAGLGDGD
jgi:hypothetical protein